MSTKQKYFVKDSQEHKEALEKQEKQRKEREERKKDNKENKENGGNNKKNNDNNNRRGNNQQRGNNNNNNNKKPRRERGDSQDSQDGYKRRYRKSKYNFNSRDVTLETEIPEIPKNIKQPDRKAFLKKLDELEDKIDKLFQEKDDKIYELYQNVKSTQQETSQEQQPIREQLNTLKGERRQLFQDWQEKKKEYKVVEQEQLELEGKKSKILSKMNFKEGITYNQIQKQIDDLNKKILNNLHGKTEENLLIKRKERLEQALPLAEPLQEVEDEIYDVEQELRRKKKQMNYHFALYKKKEEEEQAKQKEFESKREFIKENKSGLKPQVETLKQEYKNKVDKVKDERAEVKKKYTKQVEEYEDFLDLQDYVEMVNRIQDIIRQKEKKREERERKQKEYEEKQRKREAQKKAKEERERKYQERLDKEKEEEKQRRRELRALQIPFAEEIKVLTQLISYCNSVAGTEGQNEEGLTPQQQADLDEKQLKKEKLTLIQNKKNLENDDFLSQKPKNKKKNVKPQQKETNVQLAPDYETLNQFQQVGVSPPKAVENVEATLKLLVEKKDYYQKQQDEELQKRKEREENGEESEEEEDVQDQDKQNEGDNQEEKPLEEQKQKTKKQQYNYNQDDFPSMN